MDGGAAVDPGSHFVGVLYAMTGGLLAWYTGYLGGHLSLAYGVGRGERGGVGPELAWGGLAWPAMALRRPPSARVQPLEEAMAKAREAMKGMPHNAVNVRSTMAHHPAMARAFGGFANFVLNEAQTPRRQRELVILRMGWNCQAQYEFGQHTMFGLAHGVTKDEVSAVTRPLSQHAWSNEDRVLLQMVDDLYTDDCVSDSTWAELTARWSTPEIMEFVMAALCYRVVSGFLNTCGVELDDGVPGWPA